MDELILMAQAGDEEAFANMILYIKDDLYKIAKTRIANETDIEDAIQETMIETYKSIKKLNDPNKFKKWVIKILINKCNRIYRRKYKTDISIDEYNVETLKFNNIIDVENKLNFYDIIKILNYEERLIIILYYMEDYSVKEIKNILKMNENTINTHLYRARQKIKKNYGGNEYDFENKIKGVLKKEVEKPLSYDYAIKNAFYNSKNKRKSNLLLKLATTTSCLIMICTGVFATSYIVYEKVWKKPVIVNQEEENSNVEKEISKEEKENYISEEDAIKIANEVINKLDYKNIQISNVDLKRKYNNEYSGHYILRSNNILITINAETGKLEYFGDSSINNRDIKCDEISETQVNEIAREIYNKLGLFDNENKYEIVNTKKVDMAFGEHINSLWEVSFGKMYNGTYDKSNISTICFSICDNNIVISSITFIDNNNFENNPIIITKEEAIEIATNKEKEFSNLEISDTTADLSIEKMNIFIYCLENNITNENGEIKTDDITRNVWVVDVKHNKETKPKDAEIETVKKLYNKKYYIDATTGEIIGGEQSEYFNN